MVRSVFRRAWVCATILATAAALLAPSPSRAMEIAAPAMAPPPGWNAVAGLPGPTAQQQPIITKEEALAAVQRFFALPFGPGHLETQLNRANPRPTWEIMYRIDREGGSSSIGLGTVDAVTGRVLRYSGQNSDLRTPRTGPLGQAYPEQYARSWAWALVRELFPDESGPLRPMNDGLAPGRYGRAPDLYTFTWAEEHEGALVPDRWVVVYIDKTTLDYVGLESSLATPVIFTGDRAQVSADEALQKFQTSEPRLVYQPVYMKYPFPAPPERMTLVYRFDQTTLDAATGRFVASGTSAWGGGSDQGSEPVPVPAGAGSASKPAALPLTTDQAGEMARTLLDLPAGAHGVTGTDFSSFMSADAIHVYFPDFPNAGSASVNLQTGLIGNAYRNPPGPGGPWAIPKPPTAEQKAKAREAAIALVQQYYARLLSDLRIASDDGGSTGPGPGFMTFFFQRHVNGIPVGGDGVRITIDPGTLKWMNINLNWTVAPDFPKPDQVISKAEARTAFFVKRQVALVWRSAGGPGVPLRGPGVPAPLKLVYQLTGQHEAAPSAAVDAFTGKVLDWQGQPVASDAEAEAVLAGNPAEGELRYLLAKGALPAEKLNPDARLTRADALELLILGQKSDIGGMAPGIDAPYADLTPRTKAWYLAADGVRGGILAPEGERPAFGPVQPITRAEFAVWVARSLGLGKLARSPLQVQGGNAGLTGEERNAVAFLEALGIQSVGDQKAPLTQADAATMIVRAVILK